MKLTLSGITSSHLRHNTVNKLRSHFCPFFSN
jgi:hypothetical protein